MPKEYIMKQNNINTTATITPRVRYIPQSVECDYDHLIQLKLNINDYLSFHMCTLCSKAILIQLSHLGQDTGTNLWSNYEHLLKLYQYSNAHLYFHSHALHTRKSQQLPSLQGLSMIIAYNLYVKI